MAGPRPVVERPDAPEAAVAAARVKVNVEGLNAYYGSFQALKGITLGIDEGRVTALIGPSGCGKSTFLRTLNRMNDLVAGFRAEGTIRVDGEDVYGPGVDVTHLRRKVGMVFQRPNPFPMSIFDNIAYAPRRHGLRDRRRLAEAVERSLAASGLWDEVKDRLHRSALDLSGGQQQRLCIARVLAVEPEVILMDEPASALDPASTARVEDLIHRLKGAYTIVIVTHNLQQAARVADDTAFFLSGELVEHGPSRRIFTNPQDRRTEDYITGRFG